MEKPYKYDEWLKTHIDDKGVNDFSILLQFVAVSQQYQTDQKSHAGRGFWENGLLYVNYYIYSLDKNQEFIEESDIYDNEE